MTFRPLQLRLSVCALLLTIERTIVRSSALQPAYGRIVSSHNSEWGSRCSLMHSPVDIDDPTPPENLPCTVRTFVRPLDRFPPNFETRASANGKGFITPLKNERALLSNLLSESMPIGNYLSRLRAPSHPPQGGPRCDCRTRVPRCFTGRSASPDARTQGGALVSNRSLQALQVA